MKTLTHPSLVNLVNNLIQRIPVTKSGTYNQRQDATHFQKGFIEYKLKGWDFPVTIEYSDCTWVIDFKFTIHGKNKPLFESEFQWEDKDLTRGDKWHRLTFYHLYQFIKDTPVLPEYQADYEYEEDYGCPGGYYEE